MIISDNAFLAGCFRFCMLQSVPYGLKTGIEILFGERLGGHSFSSEYSLIFYIN